MAELRPTDDPLPWLMSLHHLKANPPHFQALWEGSKTFEVRWNDRDFQLADCLVMEEWIEGEPTGRAVSALVSHMLHGGEYGLADGWVCLSLKYMDRHDDRPTSTAPSPPSPGLRQSRHVIL
jgi:hypothetical protein